MKIESTCSGYIALYKNKYGFKKTKQELKCSGRHIKLALKGYSIFHLYEMERISKFVDTVLSMDKDDLQSFCVQRKMNMMCVTKG